jgi:hypothetical protein
VTVIADPATCSVQFDPIGKNKFDRSGCDIAKSLLAKAGVSYANQPAAAGAPAQLRIGAAAIALPDPRGLSSDSNKAAIAAFHAQANAALSGVGYPAKADPTQVNKPLVVGILFLLVLYVTMVYGRSRRCWWSCSRAGSATARCRCPTISATAGSAASSDHRLCDGRGDGRYLLRAVVPDRDRRAHPRRRVPPASGDPRAGDGVSLE